MDCYINDMLQWLPRLISQGSSIVAEYQASQKLLDSSSMILSGDGQKIEPEYSKKHPVGLLSYVWTSRGCRTANTRLAKTLKALGDASDKVQEAWELVGMTCADMKVMKDILQDAKETTQDPAKVDSPQIGAIGRALEPLKQAQKFWKLATLLPRSVLVGMIS